MFETTTVTAGSIMTPAVVTIGATATLREAARTMASHNVSALPVLNELGKVVGLVSEADLLRPDDVAARRRDWWLNHLADGHDLAPCFLAAIQESDRLVARVMNHDVVSVSEFAPLSEIARLLAGKNIRRVLVLREGALAGIVSRADLVRAMADGAA